MTNEERNALLEAFGSGYITDAYKLLGCHDEKNGTHVFRVWAPDALKVSVVGDFNGWQTEKGGMFHIGGGVWEGIHTNVNRFDCYKYRILTKDGQWLEKSDPFAFHASTRPDTASKVFDIGDFPWTDGEYLAALKAKDHFSSPINIYEMHLGSWRRGAGGEFLSYRILADELVPYLLEMHYTHVELLPVTEHPYDPSWGYQVTGYYAPTSRYGTPHDFMYFINKCHENGIGVILDWVGAHFPKDESGLAHFDGSFCYESPDSVMREHPDWGTLIFNYERNEVRSFLISSVCFWLTEFHADGIRADAVASMLYLDYGRAGREWHPNCFGGNYNLSAIAFLKDMNRAAFAVKPKALMIAEESTAFHGVTKPPEAGGLGFNFKWNMGWMNDTLRYAKSDPIFRKFLHGVLTFPFVYAFDENYILPFSHDEVVHGKCSLLEKMPGDYLQKFRELKAFYTYMIAFPGKKLTFMGNEFAEDSEWSESRALDWFLKERAIHAEFSRFVSELNRFYLEHPALYEKDSEPSGTVFISADDGNQSIIAFRRIAKNGDEVIAVCNFCPVRREGYRIGIPKKAFVAPIFQSDSYGEATSAHTEEIPFHGHPQSVALTLPPTSVTFYELR